MAYRLKLDESIAEGVRRIAHEQLSQAATLLRSPAGPAGAVHETRKTTKRLRALLRLVRPAIGKEQFKSLNVRLRDLSRHLAGTRDRHVMRATLSKLATPEQGRPGLRAASPDAIGAMKAVIGRLTAAAEKGDSAGRAQALREFDDAARQFDDLHLDGDGFDVIARGLKDVYRRGRRDMRRAEAGEGGDELLHDWRKMVQAHWRHMRLLTAAWPRHYEARAVLAKQLSEILGQEQDLAVLAAAVGEAGPRDLTLRQRRQLAAAIAARRAALRARAFPLGEILYADRPRDFVAAAAIHWRHAATADHAPD